MGLLRDIQVALREGLDDLLNAGASRDEVDEVLGLIEADLAEAKAELDLAMQDGRRLRERLQGQQDEADQLYRQAKAAVDRGDDAAGREFIVRRRRAQRGVDILEQESVEHEQMVDQLQVHIDTLEDKLQELRLRRDFLRTRNRVQSLRERFERYTRDYGFADGPPLEPPPVAMVSEDDEDEELPEPAGERLAPSEDQPHLVPRTRRGELPPAPADEPGLRPVAPEPPADTWQAPPRDLALEHEMLLRDIERRTRSAEYDAGIEDELRRLKQSGQQPAADEPPPPPAEGSDEAAS